MSTGLRIGTDRNGAVVVPVDLVTQAIAALARKGAGKTYTASVIVEEVIRVKVPTLIIDPTGAWWGLKSSADGEKPGLPVVIFGGDHGDVPLDPTSGKEIADVVLEHPGAYVLDLSGFESKAAEVRFVADVLERVYRRKGQDTGPLFLVVDEADIFAPQRTDRGGEVLRSLGALESIVRRGRIKGIGAFLISQRAAVLNKNVLTQTEVLIVGQTTGPQDRAAIDEWISGNGTADERATVLSSLASLERGQVWVWSPSFLRSLELVTIRTRHTFDSSRTPRPGETVIGPRAFAKVDIERLGARILAAAAKAKADDPQELRRRIAVLERTAAATREPAPPVVERVEVPVLSDADRAALENMGRLFRDGLDRVAEQVAAFGEFLSTVVDRYGPGELASPRTSRVLAVAPPAGPRPAPPPAPPARPPVATNGEAKPLTAYGRRLLDTLAARHPLTLTRAQLGILSRSSRKSSSFDAAAAEIRRLGLAELGADGTYRLTDAGWDELGDRPVAPASPDELRAAWLGALPTAEAAILRTLIAAYPQPMTRAELGQAAGYSTNSSTFQAAVPSLKKAGLADDLGGSIRAAEVLFS